MIRKLVTLITGVLLTTSILYAQTAGMGGMGRGEASIPDVDKESFIWQVPAKWYPYSKETEVKKTAYIFPTGQKPEKFKQVLQFDEFSSTVGMADASSVYVVKTDAAALKCSNYTRELEFDREQNGYSTAQWSESCVVDDKTPIYSLTKAVVGNERLYIVKKSWKFEPKKSERERWHNYFRTVYVCDPTTGKNECRSTRPERPQGGRGRR